MDMSPSLDRVGDDYRIRRRMRDFLLVRYGFERADSVLSRLADGKNVPAIRVKPEIDALIAQNWRYDDVYPVTGEDLADFAAYVGQQILIEKALSQLGKAARLALDAGISHMDFQNYAVGVFERLEGEAEGQRKPSRADRLDREPVEPGA